MILAIILLIALALFMISSFFLYKCPYCHKWSNADIAEGYSYCVKCGHEWDPKGPIIYKVIFMGMAKTIKKGLLKIVRKGDDKK